MGGVCLGLGLTVGGAGAVSSGLLSLVLSGAVGASGGGCVVGAGFFSGALLLGGAACTVWRWHAPQASTAKTSRSAAVVFGSDIFGLVIFGLVTRAPAATRWKTLCRVPLLTGSLSNPGEVAQCGMLWPVPDPCLPAAWKRTARKSFGGSREECRARYRRRSAGSARRGGGPPVSAVHPRSWPRRR